MPETIEETVFGVSDGDHAVTVRQLRTPRGRVAEIESAGATRDEPASTRIDALGLESLSWQVESELIDRIGGEAVTVAGTAEQRESFTISNEYADTSLTKLVVGDTELLLVKAPVKHTELRLHPATLVALTDCESQLFSDFLETPHGPHDH